MVGDFEGEVGVLFDEENGEPEIPVDLHDLFKNGPDENRGDPERGFVEHKAIGLAHQGPRDGEHLLFAAAERAGLLFDAFREPGKNGENLLQVGCRFLFAFAEVGAHAEVFEDGQVGKNHPTLGRLRQPAGDDLVRGESLDIRALEDNLTGGGFEDAGDGAEGRCFSGAVRTNERDDLALGDIQGDPVEGPDGAIRDRKIADLQNALTHSASLPRYAAMTAGLLRISAGFPSAILRP